MRIVVWLGALGALVAIAGIPAYQMVASTTAAAPGVSAPAVTVQDVSVSKTGDNSASVQAGPAGASISSSGAGGDVSVQAGPDSASVQVSGPDGKTSVQISGSVISVTAPGVSAVVGPNGVQVTAPGQSLAVSGGVSGSVSIPGLQRGSVQLP